MVKYIVTCEEDVMAIVEMLEASSAERVLNMMYEELYDTFGYPSPESFKFNTRNLTLEVHTIL